MHYLIGKSTGEEVQLKWRKKYGNIYTTWQGQRPVVLVTEYNLINEMFIKDAENYADRGVEQDFADLFKGGNGGIFNTDGNLWRENRRFALHVLRDMGLGKGSMQERILEEVQTLMSRIDAKCEKSNEIVINPLIDISVGSIINYLMFGYRYTDDKLSEFNELSDRARCFMQTAGDPLVFIIQSSGYINIFKQLPFMKTKFDDVMKSSNYLIDFFRLRVDEYKKSMSEEELEFSESTNYTHAFLQEKKKREKSGIGAEYFTENQLVLMVFDLWIAGQETTSNTLEWAIAYLIHNPKIQAKAHAEMDRVIGSDRLITVADKPNLPYLSALLNETLRIANLVPFNVPRRVGKDTVVEGHLLRKGTWIIPQVSLVLYDPNVYENPMEFRPERFLEKDGKSMRSDELVPFSIGKRACLGESLARMELTIFLANLINQYKFLPGKELPSLERRVGITVRPKDFYCRIVKRY